MVLTAKQVNFVTAAAGVLSPGHARECFLLAVADFITSHAGTGSDEYLVAAAVMHAAVMHLQSCSMPAG